MAHRDTPQQGGGAAGRLERSWRLARIAWSVLAAQRLLLVIALGTTLAAFVVAIATVAAGHLWVRPEQSLLARPQGLMWLVWLCALLLGTWVATVGQGLVVAGAGDHMAGRTVSVAGTWAAVRGRLRVLFAWAGLEVGALGLLDQARQHLPGGGRIVELVGQVAFRVAAFLVLPVVVFERTGAVEGLRRSARLLRATWGENLALNAGLGGLSLIAMAPAFVFAVWAGVTGALALPVTLAVAMAWLLLVQGLVAALTAVLQTGLYRWAHGLSTARGFSERDLHEALLRG